MFSQGDRITCTQYVARLGDAFLGNLAFCWFVLLGLFVAGCVRFVGLLGVIITQQTGFSLIFFEWF